MRRKLMDPLASGVLLSFIGATPAFAEKPQTVEETLVSEFEADFIRRISELGAFAKRVDQECRPTFPEGDLFPYTLTAMAFCQRATETDDHRKKAKLLNLTETLLSLAAKSVAKKLTVKPTELSRIPTYQNHGTYVGQMGLALGFYKKAGGKKPELLALENHFYRILADALKNSGGKPLYSYPGLIWPFDTAPALLMIFLHDEQEGKTIAKAHREWIIQNGVDSQFGLPVSELDLMHKISAPPRGCDLSWRLALWKSFDPEIANVWYQIYHRNFWHDMGMISGFREWPKIEGGRPSDIDSGPILYGIGSTASVLGLMSAESFEDRKSRTALINQANLLIAARKDKSEGGHALTTLLDNELAARGIQVTADCKTGFLFGDVTLFYALSWKAPSL